jgi:S1-C subfamily serine protease
VILHPLSHMANDMRGGVEWRRAVHMNRNFTHIWSSVIPVLTIAAVPASAFPNPLEWFGRAKPIPAARLEATLETGAQPSARPRADWGLEIADITPDLAQQFKLVRSTGVIVTAVSPGSSAEDAGLQPSDVIAEVTRRTVRNLSDYQEAIRAASREHTVLLLVERQGQPFFVVLSCSG